MHVQKSKLKKAKYKNSSYAFEVVIFELFNTVMLCFDRVRPRKYQVW